MDINILPLKKRDFKIARKMIIKGTHLDWYTDSRFVMNMYSKYFWCLEMSKSTRALGAYDGKKLVGVVLANINGEKKYYKNFFYKLTVKFVDFMMKIIFKGTSDVYENANKEMFEGYQKTINPDGEICFFAVEPELNGKGIGTKLLNEFEKDLKDKTLYLYTDSGCTYQFYDKRGFTRFSEKEIEMKKGKEPVKIKCFLYSKKI